MSITENFAAYAAAFEETYVDDDWSRLRPFFTEDAVYMTVSDDGTETRFEGIDSVLEGLRDAVNTFDRRFATRKVDVLGDLEPTDGEIVFDWAAEYTASGAPTLRIAGTEHAIYQGDRIRHMKDVFKAGTTEMIAGWIAEHGEKLAPQKT